MGEFLLVPAYPGSPGSTAVKRLCVCVLSPPFLIFSSDNRPAPLPGQMS